MTLFIHTLYLLFKYRYKMVQTKGNFSSILRQTYDLELSLLAEYKMDFFPQQNAASIKRLMSKGVTTNPAGLKKATKERTAVLCKSHDHGRAKFGKTESQAFAFEAASKPSGKTDLCH